ncbi:transport protein [Cutibacterium modestum 30N]|nr:transport protein [Cutibacterium modestum 28N]MCP2379852.1 transport protein [Cutibacterium modestum 30N]
MPTMQTILISSAGKAQATQAMTVVGLPAVIVPVLGPLLGGFLLDKVRW